MEITMKMLKIGGFVLISSIIIISSLVVHYRKFKKNKKTISNGNKNVRFSFNRGQQGSLDLTDPKEMIKTFLYILPNSGMNITQQQNEQNNSIAESINKQNIINSNNLDSISPINDINNSSSNTNCFNNNNF